MAYQVTASPTHDAEMRPICVYRLRRYAGAGTASVIESLDSRSTRTEAETARDRVNAGDVTGLRFACYADD
jgi:hypothetical protein